MKYREFGELKTKVSALGFGCMRLPTLDGLPQSGNIDEAETIRMIRRAVDGYGGLTVCQIQYNYMDTENQAGRSGLKYASAPPSPAPSAAIAGCAAGPPRLPLLDEDGLAEASGAQNRGASLFLEKRQ